MFINHGPCSTARLTLLYYIQAYAKYYILKQRHRYFIVCTQCYCQRVSLQAVGFLVWNHSANKYDIRYVCRLCWQHANFHLHFPFVKLHKKHRQLFAQNSSAKRTACLIVIQVVSRLKQTTRTTASTRINYPRKLLANNAQRNGTAHGNAGADRTGPGSGLRAPGTGYWSPGYELRYRFRFAFAFVLGRSLSVLCGLCVLAMSSSTRWSSSLCARCCNVGMVLVLAWTCGRRAMKLRPQCLSMCRCVCVCVCTRVSHVYMYVCGCVGDVQMNAAEMKWIR